MVYVLSNCDANRTRDPSSMSIEPLTVNGLRLTTIPSIFTFLSRVEYTTVAPASFLL
jgi:hypothetical protein